MESGNEDTILAGLRKIGNAVLATIIERGGKLAGRMAPDTAPYMGYHWPDGRSLRLSVTKSGWIRVRRHGPDGVDDRSLWEDYPATELVGAVGFFKGYILGVESWQQPNAPTGKNPGS